jgi:hypothetical protein
VSLVALKMMDSQAKMSVVLRNNNSTLSVNEFEIYDNVCGELIGTFTLKGGESRTVEIGEDSDGKGSVKIRNPDLGPNDWTQIASINPGDVITA